MVWFTRWWELVCVKKTEVKFKGAKFDKGLSSEECQVL